MARGDCNITNICIPTRRIIYAAGFTPPPPPPPPPECNFPSGTFAQGGAICDWGYRVRYDVASAFVPSDQTDFPLSVDFREIVTDLTPANAATFWNEVSRESIRVTLVDGTTEIPHYTHGIDAINETGRLTALIPNLSGSVATRIFIYFANPSATEYAVGNALGRNIVFAEFRNYYDTEQNPAGVLPQLTDLTGNGNDATTFGTMTLSDLVDGKVGKAWDFDGVNDHAVKTSPTFEADTQGTVSLWVKVESVFGANGVKVWYGFGGNTQVDPAFWHIAKRRADATGGQTLVQITNRLPPTNIARGYGTTTPLVAGTWFNVVLTSDSTAYAIKINNVSQTIALDVGTNDGKWFGSVNALTPTKGTVAALLNNGSSTPSAPTDDIIGPVGIRNSVVSDNRLTTEYNNQNAPGTFATFTNFLASGL